MLQYPFQGAVDTNKRCGLDITLNTYRIISYRCAIFSKYRRPTGPNTHCETVASLVGPNHSVIQRTPGTLYVATNAASV